MKKVLAGTFFLLAVSIVIVKLISSNRPSLKGLDYGGKIPAYSFFDIKFNYSTDIEREGVIELKKFDKKWIVFSKVRISLPSAKDQVIAVTLPNRNSDMIEGPGYLLEVKMVDKGTFSEVAVMKEEVTVENGYQGFTIKDGSLVDANGKSFLIRGINNAHADWDNFGRNYAHDALDEIAKRGFNAVRVVWRENIEGGLGKADLDNTIKTIIDNKMIPIIVLHDATGSPEVKDLLEITKWYQDNIELLIKYRKFIVVNIANEWSPYGTKPSKWFMAYKKAIHIIRKSGYSGTLMIDAPAYAQDPNGPKLFGQELLGYDPSHNLIFSVHMYAEWGGKSPAYSITNELQIIKNKSIPFVIGEFSHKHPSPGCKEVEIDYKLIMRECKKHEFGYVAWSWYGNGTGDCNIDLSYLNIATDWQGSNITSPFGIDLINYKGFGITSTSKICSIFNSHQRKIN